MKSLLIFFFVSLPSLLSAQNYFQTGQSADLMLSGYGFNTTGGGLQFNHPSGLASDGKKLLVCDRFNNRILVWNTAPTAWNTPPDIVLGQENFSTNEQGTEKNKFNFPGNACLASNGTLAVADTENDRILLWTSFPTANGSPANISLNLDALSEPGKNKLGWTWGVWTDGKKLVATATRGSALLFWNTLPTHDDQKPDYTMALPQFGTPRNISTDGATYFFVGDHNARVNGTPGTFFWNSYPSTATQQYDFYRNEWIKGAVSSDGKLVAGGLMNIYVWNSMPKDASASPNLVLPEPTYANGDGPDVVHIAGRVYVNNYNGNNVLVYSRVPQSAGERPEFALSCSSLGVNTLDSMGYIQNPTLASDGISLIATSDFDKEVWVWKSMPQKSGTKPDFIQKMNGSADLSPRANALHNRTLVAVGGRAVGIWDSTLFSGGLVRRIFRDTLGGMPLINLVGVAYSGRYFCLVESDGRVSVWKNLPITGKEPPLKTFAIPLPSQTISGAAGDDSLLAAISMERREAWLYAVDDLLTSASPVAKKTLQPSSVFLNLPSRILPFHGGVAIANTSANSVLLWEDWKNMGNPDYCIVLGQKTPDANEPGISPDRMFMPASMVFDGSHLWVGEFKFSSRILRFSPQEKITKPINWKPFFTLEPTQGIHFVLDTSAIVRGGGVPGINVTSEESLILGYGGIGQGRGALEIHDNGQTYLSKNSAARPMHIDGGFVYLPDGRVRFVTEEPSPNSTQQRHRSRIISWISTDGVNWSQESGIRYQPGLLDDSIASVPSVIQMKDSLWRMYYVGDFYRTNGIRTAISSDWGKTWQAESLTNILKNGDVDPHPVYLSNGSIRLYFRTGFGSTVESERGIAYCDSKNGVEFAEEESRLLIPDTAQGGMMKLDPCVVRFPNGDVACYIGAAPVMGSQQIPKLIVAREAKLTGVENSYSAHDQLLTLIPNPVTTSDFQISFPRKYPKIGVKVFSLLGAEVFAGWTESGFVHLPAEVSAGRYTVQISTEQGELLGILAMILIR